MKFGEAKAALDALGIEGICALIYEDKSLRQIAKAVGCSPGTLVAWIAADPERSARARDARRVMSQMWEEKAESVIRLANDPLKMAKARELAHHYRWRASKTDPANYGNKVQAELSGPAGTPIQTEAVVTVEAGEAYLRMLNGRT